MTPGGVGDFSSLLSVDHALSFCCTEGRILYFNIFYQDWNIIRDNGGLPTGEEAVCCAISLTPSLLSPVPTSNI